MYGKPAKKDFYDNLESGLPGMQKLCLAQLSTVICQDGVKMVLAHSTSVDIR